jgi:cytochrome c5
MNQNQDAKFIRKFSIVLGGLVVIGIACFMLAQYVYSRFAETPNPDQRERRDQEVSQRIAPVGQVNVGTEALTLAAEDTDTVAVAQTGAAAETSADPGKTAYDKICFACHAQGIAGAPKFGDKAAWEPRLQKGVDMLVSNVVNGFQGETGVMPPRGGLPNLSDEDVRASVIYMLQAVGYGGGGGSGAAVEPETVAEERVAAAGTSADAGRGKEVYDAACFVCHTPGAAGAPKFGDAADWSGRVDQGTDVLYGHAISGYMGKAGLMPPKGGRPDLSDDDVMAAVDYMLANGQ